jgi:hypothetical protein
MNLAKLQLHDFLALSTSGRVMDHYLELLAEQLASSNHGFLEIKNNLNTARIKIRVVARNDVFWYKN